MNRNIFIINDENKIVVENINYTTIYDVKDKTKKQLIYAKLEYENDKLFIETDKYNVIEFNPDKKYLKVELDNNSFELFNSIDNRGIELLELLLESDEVRELNLEKNITFSTLSKLDEKTQKNYLRVRLCENTKINLNKKQINIDDFNKLTFQPDDNVRFLLEMDSLNLYPQENICGIKCFCSYIDIQTHIDENLFCRPKIDNYKFSALKNNNIILEEYECDYGATDMSPKQHNNSNITNITNIPNIISDFESVNESKIFITTSEKKPIKRKAPPKKSNIKNN